jgi:hypothetical protein
MTETETPRQRIIRRGAELKSERGSHDATDKEIAQYVQPYRERFNLRDTNRGDKKTQMLINNEPTLDADTNAAGMEAGITSPTRPWVHVTLKDKKLAEVDAVRVWLGQLEDRMLGVIGGSNAYLSFHEAYVDITTFSTAVEIIDEDEEKVIHCTVVPRGTYALSANAKGEVDTLYRWLPYTVRQMVDEFGYENCSLSTRNAYDRKAYEEYREVLHAIEPNAQVIPSRIGPEGMAYRSWWLEVAGTDADGFLKQKGYHEKPFIAPRWSRVGQDVYGSGGPGQKAIGDCKSLQEAERRLMQLTEKLTDPPMVGPASMRDEPVDLLPGGINYEGSDSGGRGFRPAIELPAQALTAIDSIIERITRRIARTFYADLWRMLSAIERGQMTAEEVRERLVEKMLQLGPMLERFQDEALRPFIRRVFAIMLRYGLVPEPPQELQGMELDIEFVSILAQAQKMVGIQAVRELVSFGIQTAQADPDALDNVDLDAAIAEMGRMLGAPPDLVRSKDEVQNRRNARAQAKAQQAQMQQAQVAAETAKTAAGADLEGDNVLSRMLKTVGPAAVA